MVPRDCHARPDRRILAPELESHNHPERTRLLRQARPPCPSPPGPSPGLVGRAEDLVSRGPPAAARRTWQRPSAPGQPGKWHRRASPGRRRQSPGSARRSARGHPTGRSRTSAGPTCSSWACSAAGPSARAACAYPAMPCRAAKRGGASRPPPTSSPSSGDTVFADDKLGATIVDRVTRSGKLVEFGGPSRRLKESLMLGKGERE